MRKVSGAAVLLLIAVAVVHAGLKEMRSTSGPDPDRDPGNRVRVMPKPSKPEPGVVPVTGQTACWDADGDPVDCAGTGQDGEYRMGFSVDPRARFTNNGDGTVTDNLTKLVWLQQADCFGPQDWSGALSSANALAEGSCGLSDGSAAGDWRLPNVTELFSLVDHGRTGPALPPGHPFIGVQLYNRGYWSSTSSAGWGDYAFGVAFYMGNLYANVKFAGRDVWPVRGGY